MSDKSSSTRSVELLIGSSAPVDEVAHQVADAASAYAMATTDPHVWELRFGEVTTSLGAYRAKRPDDPFGLRYPYALVTQMAEGSTPVDSQEVRALRDAARALRDATDLRTVLVLDAQNLATQDDSPGTAPGRVVAGG